MCVCVMCWQKCCYDCKKVAAHFREAHGGVGLAFNLMTGGFFFVRDGRATGVPSVYVNAIGVSWKPEKAGDKFCFDSTTYN